MVTRLLSLIEKERLARNYFPDDKVELGESFSDAVIREVKKEETGLDIYSPQLCGIGTGTTINVSMWFCFIKQVTLRETSIF